MSNSYYEQTRFLIIAPKRSGGTLLSHALDSHMDIFCHRGEPIHRLDPIRQIADSPFEAIDTCLKMMGYEASGCKLTYEDVKRIGLESIRHFKVNRIIHLWRENPLKRIVSEQVRLQDKKQGLRTHTRESRPLETITLDPQKTVSEIGKYWADVNMYRRILKSQTVGTGKAYMEIIYEQIAYYHNIIERDLGFALQDFLGTSTKQMLKYSIVKRNPFPLRDIIENYDELYEYMRNHAYLYLKYFEDTD